MEARQMIEIAAHRGEGFSVMSEFGEWKIGMLRHSERFSRLGEMERHMLTDEAFVLLSGEATLYTDKEELSMQKETVYTVPVGVWHHIVVNEDACVLVVENRSTSKENTQKKYFD